MQTNNLRIDKIAENIAGAVVAAAIGRAQIIGSGAQCNRNGRCG